MSYKNFAFLTINNLTKFGDKMPIKKEKEPLIMHPRPSSIVAAMYTLRDLHPKTLGVNHIVESEFGATLREMAKDA